MAQGVIPELMEHNLKKCLDNIADPNTGLGERSVTMTIKIKPSSDRRAAKVVIIGDSKLQNAVSAETNLFLGKDGTKNVAWENNPEQLVFAENVTNIKDVKENYIYGKS